MENISMFYRHQFLYGVFFPDAHLLLGWLLLWRFGRKWGFFYCFSNNSSTLADKHFIFPFCVLWWRNFDSRNIRGCLTRGISRKWNPLIYSCSFQTHQLNTNMTSALIQEKPDRLHRMDREALQSISFSDLERLKSDWTCQLLVYSFNISLCWSKNRL